MSYIIRLKKLWLIAILLLPVTACSLSSGSISGQVLDDKTGDPVPGAIVVVTWQGDWASFAHSKTACYHVETAITDTEGKYYIAAWSLPWEIEDMTVSRRQIFFDAYKPGYVRSAKPNEPSRVFLARFNGTKDQYFDNLDSLLVANRCPGGGQSIKNLYRLYAPMAEEAKALTETPKHRVLVDNLLRTLTKVSE